MGSFGALHGLLVVHIKLLPILHTNTDQPFKNSSRITKKAKTAPIIWQRSVTLAMRIPLTHWCRVRTSSQHRYLMYWDFFWIWGCCTWRSEHVLFPFMQLPEEQSVKLILLHSSRWQHKTIVNQHLLSSLSRKKTYRLIYTVFMTAAWDKSGRRSLWCTRSHHILNTSIASCFYFRAKKHLSSEDAVFCRAGQGWVYEQFKGRKEFCLSDRNRVSCSWS